MRTRRAARPRPQAGFTLIEIIVAMSLLSLLAGAAAAISVRVLRGNLQERALKRMRAIYTAMVGDVERGDYGYLGDMGELPDHSLGQLYSRTCASGPTTGPYDCTTLPNNTNPPAGVADATDGIFSGWNGAYIVEGVDTARGFIDPWNMPFAYTPGTAQLTSYGPNRTAGGGDDIVFPSVLPVLSGTVTVTVKGMLSDGGPPINLRSDEATVAVYYTRASDNTRAAATVTYPGAAGSGIWKTNSALHRGLHSVVVTGADASGAGGHNFSGSNAREIARVTTGPAFVTVLLNQAP